VKSAWRPRIIAAAIYTLAAVGVAWVNRGSLSYLDAWAKFASVAGIPSLALLGYYLWDRSHPDAGERWKKGLAISFTVVISLATVWLASAALFISIVAWMTPTNNVRKFEAILSKGNSPFTAHFPRHIPADARTVRFYYDPGALQAATILELGYTTTPERIDALYRDYARRATLALTAGMENGVIEPMNIVKGDSDEFLDFSNDYTLFYLDEKPPKDEQDWNHPQSHGVAISKKRHRVVFWAWSG